MQSAIAALWFSNSFENPLVGRVIRRMVMLNVRLNLSTWMVQILDVSTGRKA